MMLTWYDAVAVRDALARGPAEQPIDVATYNGVVTAVATLADAVRSDDVARGKPPTVRIDGIGAVLVGHAPEPEATGDAVFDQQRADVADALSLLLRRLRADTVIVAEAPIAVPADAPVPVALTGLAEYAALDPRALPPGHGLVLNPEAARIFVALQPAVNAVLARARRSPIFLTPALRVSQGTTEILALQDRADRLQGESRAAFAVAAAFTIMTAAVLLNVTVRIVPAQESRS